MEENEYNDPNEVDRILKSFLVVLAIIIIIGVVMVYSSSYIFAKEVYGNSAYFFIKQTGFLAIALLLAFVVSRTKFNFWIKFSVPINIMAALLLILTFIPGLGVAAKGASRWLSFGGIGFQPGEIVKYTLLLSSLSLFEKWNDLTPKKRSINTASILLPLTLLVLQPDFGTFAVSFVVMAFICFMSSFPRKTFYLLTASGAIIGTLVLFAQPYRVKRLLTFMDPWKNPRGSGFQIIQSYMGFANGSIFGQGLGNSHEKLFYLPEAHNDFIFSVIGEELGFFGVCLLAFLFLAFIFFGFKMAIKIQDRIGQLMVSGVVFTIGLQALLNMSVVLGLLPTKGLNLPFVSSGGSSLVANFFGIGIILAVARGNRDEQENEENNHLQGFRSYQSARPDSADSRQL